MHSIIHRSEDRGKGSYGWLNTRYSFSFANWYDPTRMGFGALRVINDDSIAPHSGFDTHGHRDMEIITFIREGTLTHRDSMGNVGEIHAGEVQVMSAGTGVLHSEKNEGDTPVTLFQIWMMPKNAGVEPHYAQKSFETNANEIILLVGPKDTDGALTINQDAYISRAVFDAEHPLTYTFKDHAHGVYIFVVEGTLSLLNETLEARDAMGIVGTAEVTLSTPTKAEVFIFEVPME